VLESDRAHLRLVLQNILGNAVTYADEGGRIRVESAAHNGTTELAVTNTGSRLDSRDAARVFDRFWRGDDARVATGQHCGLGLSLCKTFVELLGGSIRAALPGDGQFRIVMALAQRASGRSCGTGVSQP